MILFQIQPIGDIIEPNRIEFSFGAPGWTILLLLVLAAVFVFGLWKLCQYKKNKYRRLALAELNLIEISTDKTSSILTQIVFMLNRVAIKAYGREEVVELNGLPFMRFLQSKVSSDLFSEGSESVFKRHIYEGKNSKLSFKQLESFYNESINWIKQHRV